MITKYCDHSDMELVREYTSSQSESAFAELVSRYTNLVYSAALRQAFDQQLAEEVTQVVFIILSRKAGALDAKTILSSWLYRTACYVTDNLLKSERRRRHREQEAYMQSANLEIQTDSTWKQMSPLLDEAILLLRQADRDALALRFFEGRSLNEIGSALGTSEEAATKRVARAVDKLRLLFTNRGIGIPAAALTTAMLENSVQAAPTGLARSVTIVALAKGTAASASTLTLVNGVMKYMTWLKIQTAIVVSTIAVLAGAGAYESHQVSELRAQNQSLQLQEVSLSEQIKRLQQARDGVTTQQTSFQPPQQNDTSIKTFEEIKAKAEKGDPEAQYVLSSYYIFGTGALHFYGSGLDPYNGGAGQSDTTANNVEALKWLRMAAEQNYVKAQYILGNCYQDGWWGPKDQAEGVKWLRMAAEQNLPSAQYFLGNSYATGTGVSKDFSEAVKWYLKAADHPKPLALFELAQCYAKGQGGDKR